MSRDQRLYCHTLMGFIWEMSQNGRELNCFSTHQIVTTNVTVWGVIASYNHPKFQPSKLWQMLPFFWKGLVIKKKLFPKLKKILQIFFSQILTFWLKGYEIKQLSVLIQSIPICNFGIFVMSWFDVTVLTWCAKDYTNCDTMSRFV